MQTEIRFKKCGISNQPNVCIFDDPCLSKFGALLGSCPHPGRQFVGLLSPVCRTCTRRIVQTWKRHGIRCKHSAGRNAHIFLQRIFHLHFHMKSPSVFLTILLINPKNDILIAAIPFCLLYYSSSPRKISLRSTSSASSFPSALACSSGYFDPVRSISITDA